MTVEGSGTLALDAIQRRDVFLIFKRMHPQFRPPLGL
jgi:hypothetical protein